MLILIIVSPEQFIMFPQAVLSALSELDSAIQHIPPRGNGGGGDDAGVTADDCDNLAAALTDMTGRIRALGGEAPAESSSDTTHDATGSSSLELGK